MAQKCFMMKSNRIISITPLYQCYLVCNPRDMTQNLMVDLYGSIRSFLMKIHGRDQFYGHRSQLEFGILNRKEQNIYSISQLSNCRGFDQYTKLGKEFYITFPHIDVGCMP